MMQDSFGKVIPVTGPVQRKDESVWSKFVEIYKITENGSVTYDFMIQPPSGGQACGSVDDLVSRHLTEIVQHLSRGSR
jgi:hypothetical protein